MSGLRYVDLKEELQFGPDRRSKRMLTNTSGPVSGNSSPVLGTHQNETSWRDSSLEIRTAPPSDRAGLATSAAKLGGDGMGRSRSSKRPRDVQDAKGSRFQREMNFFNAWISLARLRSKELSGSSRQRVDPSAALR